MGVNLKATKALKLLKEQKVLDLECIQELLQLTYPDKPSVTLCQTIYKFIISFCSFDPVFAMLKDSLNFQAKFEVSHILEMTTNNDSKVNNVSLNS